MDNMFDLSMLALKAIAPNNEVLYDDVGLPSFMVRIPKMTYAELGLGESTDVFPAFIVNGSVVEEIYISKYQNCVYNGRAYSLPARAPQTSINLETAISRCSAKGAGWHVMTKMEHALLMLWCEKNGFMPIGNNNYGKHSSETLYKALPANSDADHFRVKTLTGTGPLTWYHDNSLGGIADLCGNVWEWSGGVRTVYGELQILVNNNAADTSHSQTADSAEWRAIDAATGELITPDGTGTTEGSVKMDWVNSHLQYSTTITTQAAQSRSCTLASITCDETIGTAAQLLLKTLCMLPLSTTILGASHLCYFNNGEAERCFSCGGYYNNSANGACSFSGNSARSNSSGSIGFRSAFVKLPTA